MTRAGKALAVYTRASWLRTLVLFSVFAFFISSCGSNPLVGRWRLVSLEGNNFWSCLGCIYEGDVAEFLPDGTLINGTCVLQYEILDDSRFKCTAPLGSLVHEYQVEGDELTVRDSGREWVLTRISDSE